MAFALTEVHDPGTIGAFAGGMLSFLSPCVLPLVPGYLSLVSGLSVAELQEGERGNVRRGLASTQGAHPFVAKHERCYANCHRPRRHRLDRLAR